MENVVCGLVPCLWYDSSFPGSGQLPASKKEKFLAYNMSLSFTAVGDVPC
jgi:hypothetical protein